MIKPDDLMVVYTTNDVTDAEIVRAALHSEGIKCEIDGQQQGGFTGIMQVKLLVRAEDFDRARKYVQQHES